MLGMRQETQEIVVDGWSPRFAKAVTKLLGIEGGYVNDKHDKGGATRYGISLHFLKSDGLIDADKDGFADFDLDFDDDIDVADIRKLSVADARALYHRCFWRPLGCDNYAQPIGEMLFDQAVNGGAHAAKRMLQQAINRCLAKSPSAPEFIAEDGKIGAKTYDAMNWVVCWGQLGMPALISAYREAVKSRYRAIAAADPTQKRFLNGWINRADELGRA